jgi:hypothetical protein
MQAKMMEARTLRELPFTVGVFQGHGAWADRQGGQGAYQAELTILTGAGGVIMHIGARVFLSGDGAVLHQENSRVQFIPSADPFFEVIVGFEGKEYRGHGYCFGNRCHYEVALGGGGRIEATYTLNEEGIQLLGSSTRDGNLTVWAETLTRDRRV